MPAYDDVTSLRYWDGGWTIGPCTPPDKTAPDFGLSLDRRPLDGPAFVRVLDAVAAHA